MSDDSIRLDKWLWFARFLKTRSLASQLCKSGKLRLNRATVGKSNAQVRAGDVLTFPLGPRIRVVRVVALGVRRGPAGEAQQLYEDLLPAAGWGRPTAVAAAGQARPPRHRPSQRRGRARMIGHAWPADGRAAGLSGSVRPCYGNP